MKPMTRNTMLYDHVHEGIEIMPLNDFRNNCYPLKKIEEQPAVNDTATPEVQDPIYIRWKIFDEISEPLYTIKCEGYFNKNGRPLDDGTTVKHLTNGDHVYCVDDEYYDENGVIGYIDYDDCPSMNHNKYDLRKFTKQIRSKKFICEAPIISGKLTAICNWISSYKTNRFMVVVPTVNIAEKFYTKLNDMNVNSIRLYVNDNAFKYLCDLIEEYYEREQRPDYFLMIDGAHLLLQHISIIEITKEFDRVALMCATANIKHFRALEIT